jgi:hypothetical protein
MQASSPKTTQRFNVTRPKANTDGIVKRRSLDPHEILRRRMASSAPQPAAHIHDLRDTPMDADPALIETQLQRIYFVVKRMFASDETPGDATSPPISPKEATTTKRGSSSPPKKGRKGSRIENKDEVSFLVHRLTPGKNVSFLDRVQRQQRRMAKSGGASPPNERTESAVDESEEDGKACTLRVERHGTTLHLDCRDERGDQCGYIEPRSIGWMRNSKKGFEPALVELRSEMLVSCALQFEVRWRCISSGLLFLVF